MGEPNGERWLTRVEAAQYVGLKLSEFAIEEEEWPLSDARKGFSLIPWYYGAGSGRKDYVIRYDKEKLTAWKLRHL